MEVGLRLRLRALGHCCGHRGGFPPAACSRHLRPHRGVSSSTAFCSLAASVSGAAVGPVGSGAEVARAKRMLHVVLVFPLIPGRKYRINSEDVCSVGSWPASCRGKPLGYKVDDTKLKRAGLDYWLYVVKIHDSWDDFRDYFMNQDGRKKRLLAFTKRGTNIHSDFSYKPGDWLVSGSETKGLPQSALDDCCREGLGP